MFSLVHRSGALTNQQRGIKLCFPSFLPPTLYFSPSSVAPDGKGQLSSGEYL